MNFGPSPFRSATNAAFAASPAAERLGSHSAVILERLARGGGATRWYHCTSVPDLEEIKSRLSPGSIVSLYFDDRIKRAERSRKVEDELHSILAATGEVLVGASARDPLIIEMECVSGPNELAELLAQVPPKAGLFYGSFPARDNDGSRAITLDLPDIDGIQRPHPH